MSRNVIKYLLIALAVILAAELVLLVFLGRAAGAHLQNPDATQATVLTEPTQPSTLPPTQPSETAAPTEPTETEPQPERFVLSFVGDCTLGSTANAFASPASFISVIGEDYNYPFRNVAEYFATDDFSIINLETALANGGNAADKLFAFRGPTAYTEIMTGSAVEAVTLANNHSQDYGSDGYNSTVQALTDAGVAYVEKDKTALYTTESGLTIGLYAAAFQFNEAAMKKQIAQLRADGAEVVIAAFHWGDEGRYRPNGTQEYFGRAAIEAGANIVYGHHPHVLQRIEQYQDGVIFYSLGNFSFGGNHFPKDYDTAIVQQEIIRQPDGTIQMGNLEIIPCSMSSEENRNNFQPTPLEETDDAYQRVLSKLDGSFRGPDLVVNYPDPEETTPTEDPESTAPTGDGSTEPSSPAEGSGSTEPPASSENGGGDSGSEGGGDSGSEGGGDSGSADGGDAGNGSSDATVSP